MRKIYIADFGIDCVQFFSVNPDNPIHEVSEFGCPGGEPSEYYIGEDGQIRIGLDLFSLPFNSKNKVKTILDMNWNI